MNLWNRFLNLFHPTPPVRPVQNAPEEHHITLPGMDISFNHTTKTVWIVDQAGTSQFAMDTLEAWLSEKGYFLHYVLVTPSPEEPKTK